MIDSNEDLKDEGDFSMFTQNSDLVDIVTQFDPLLAQDLIYLQINNRLDYILLSPNLV